MSENLIQKKTKVLVLPSDTSGCGKFRSVDPHLWLERYYPEEFHVDISYEVDFNNINFWKQYDIVHFHRTLVVYENMEQHVKMLKDLGIVVIMDLDDYWSPGQHHPAYHIIKKHELDKKIVNNLKLADYVTTTTQIFANEINKFNKNTCVLPNAINPDDKQFTPNPESSERVRIGWLGGSCMTPDTEILTNKGWRRFDMLDKTEKVATLNPKNNELEYHKPKAYISEPFEGNLNCAKNGLIEYEVTPNHNMYASVAKSLTQKKLDLTLIQSEKIHGQNFHIKKDAIWNGKEENFFILPKLIEYSLLELEYAYDDNLSRRKNNKGQDLYEKYGSDRFIEMDKWLEFFGFWIAEGWVSKTEGLHQVGVAQTKDNGYLEHMYNILVDMGFKPTYTKDKKQVRVFDKQLWNFLSRFGDAFNKFIPKDTLNLCSRQLEIFLEWFIKGDGHIEKNKYQRMRAYTCSPELANNLQEIALKIGISATITNRGKRTTAIKGRKIINQYDSLVINFTKHPSISKHNKNTPLIKSDDQYQKYYKGNVYCVEVQNNIIYVRRAGKSMWIGNSHARDLAILDGMVSQIKAAGLIDKVQFVVCGFDLRGNVTVYNKDTGEETVRNITPQESVWFQYEKIFTDNYTIVSPEYKAHLLKFENKEYSDIANEAYRRVWTKPVTSYASNYNLFDIALAPVEENIFNKVKSQLKVIEAGFHKKALVASDFGPYQIDLTNVYERGGEINLNGNAFLVDSSKNHKFWGKHLIKMIENPELIKTLATNLHNTVKDKYSAEAVSKLRRDFYLTIVNK